MTRLLQVLFLAAFCSAEQPAVFDGNAWFSLSDEALRPDENRRPLPPISESWRDPAAEIYVSLAAFRDSKRCAATLKDLFSKASHPDRVRVGLVQQTNNDEKDCLSAFCGSER